MDDNQLEMFKLGGSDIGQRSCINGFWVCYLLSFSSVTCKDLNHQLRLQIYNSVECNFIDIHHSCSVRIKRIIRSGNNSRILTNF